MEGVIEEGQDALEKDEEGSTSEAGLIVGAALRTAHYEIASYEACISMATALALPKIVKLLNST